MPGLTYENHVLAYEPYPFPTCPVYVNMSIPSDIAILEDLAILENARKKSIELGSNECVFHYIMLFLMFVCAMTYLYFINPIYTLIGVMLAAIITWVVAMSYLIS